MGLSRPDAAHLVVAVALTYVLGFERDLRGAPTGDRVFALVGAGAGVVGIIAAHGAPNVLAGAITGIGFIGGGLVFRQAFGSRQVVMGVTTDPVKLRSMQDRKRRRGWVVIGPDTRVIGPGTVQWQWRGLFEDLLAYQGDDWAGEVIGPWAERHAGVIAELHAIGAPGNHRARITWRRGEYSALEGLYALGRVLDVLAAPYQPVNEDPALLSWINGRPWWTGRIPDQGTLPAFANGVGAARISEEKFHPFFHEISAVEPASDPDAPVELVAEVWPGYLAGSLLLARAGVIVRAGSAALDPEVAARSCLYWAWWRRNRTTADRSHGWGANSQWGTDFRRDYIADGQLHYNVDGYKSQPSASDGDLSGAEAQELLRHRCSTRHDLGRDRWPWHLTLTEPAP